MSTEYFTQGRLAFRDGKSIDECPYPARFVPPRSVEDQTAPHSGPGAFWLDGFEQERDGDPFCRQNPLPSTIQGNRVMSTSYDTTRTSQGLTLDEADDFIDRLADLALRAVSRNPELADELDELMGWNNEEDQ